MLVQVVGQGDAILERAVHALAVERHHRVGGIADQHGAAVEVPAVQVQGTEHADRIGLVVVPQCGDQRQRIREVAFEQRLRIVGGLHPGEARVCAGMRHEQGHGEGPLVVRQGDAHVVAARPDMQGVRIQPVAAVGQ